MPVITDSQGNIYRIPSAEMEKYKMTAEEVAKLPERGVDLAIVTPASDDVELQEMRAPRISTHAHNWFGGD